MTAERVPTRPIDASLLVATVANHRTLTDIGGGGHRDGAVAALGERIERAPADGGSVAAMLRSRNPDTRDAEIPSATAAETATLTRCPQS